MDDEVRGKHALSPPRTLQDLLDSRAIFLCLQRISRGMDRFDRELFLSGLHADAVVEAGVFVGGPTAAYEAGASMHEQSQISTQHYLMNHSCDIDGDIAHTETYFLFVAHNRDDTNWSSGGRYIDRLERRDGEWKIAFRHTSLEWSAMLPTATIPLFADAPDVHLNGSPSRNGDDPSYRRPLTNRRQLSDQADARDLSNPDR